MDNSTTLHNSTPSFFGRDIICRKILAEIGKCPEAAFGLGVQNPHKVKTVDYIQRKRQNGQNRTVCVKRGMRWSPLFGQPLKWICAVYTVLLLSHWQCPTGRFSREAGGLEYFRISQVFPGTPDFSGFLKYRVYPKCKLYPKFINNIIPNTSGHLMANGF